MSVGYDNLDINHNIVLDLPFREGAGAVARDYSQRHYPFTLTGVPAWDILATAQPVLDFTAATPDYLTCPIATAAAMDFTNEDFSIASWVNPDTLVGDLTLLCHGLAVTDGYYIEVLANGSIQFTSNQAAAAQLVISAVGAVVIDTWTLVGISRSGTAVQIFVNGVETGYVAQPAIINPLTSARAVLFGVYDDLATNPWSHYLGRQRAWLARQLTAANHSYIWDTERSRYNV